MLKKIILAFATANMGRLDKVGRLHAQSKTRLLYNDALLPKPRDLESRLLSPLALLDALNGDVEKIEERELLTSLLAVLFRHNLKWKVAQKILLVLFRIVGSDEWPLARSNLIQELSHSCELELQAQTKSSGKEKRYLGGLALAFTKSAFKYLCALCECVRAVPRFFSLKRPATSSRKTPHVSRSPEPKTLGKRGGSLKKSQLSTASLLVKALSLFNRLTSDFLGKFLSLKKTIPIMRALFSALFQPLKHLCLTLDPLLLVLSEEAHFQSSQA